jgi:aminoglycoside 6'-N-acetyltransferase I
VLSWKTPELGPRADEASLMPDSAPQPRSPPAHVRIGRAADTDIVARMFFELWPEGPLAEHQEEAALILAGAPPSTMPLVVLVAETDDRVIGFIEVGLRSHADGCDTRQPVGFIEGWYVEPKQRGKGVGRVLMQAAEDWARSLGCRELASDTWIDHEPSQRAHDALGFEVVDRCVNFKKALR